MHGLVNRAIQSFAYDTYGPEQWAEVVANAQLETDEFEAMLQYDDALTVRALDALAAGLERTREEVIEDIGTYLVSHPNREALRRLLRFGGVTFSEFLDTLDELPGRARLAVSDLDLPEILVRRHAADRYSLTVFGAMPGWGNLFVGILRAMADDYGALAMLDFQASQSGTEVIDVQLVESMFSEGRSFDLAQELA